MDDSYDITIDELDEKLCWRLLARARFGRVGFVHDGEVIVLPVNAAVDAGRVIFRTAADTTIAATARHQPTVAFQTDHTDQIAESGWSVLVRGRLRDVTDTPESSEWGDSMVHPWAPPPRDRWMCIDATTITGRTIHRHRRIPPGVRLPYMPPD